MIECDWFVCDWIVYPMLEKQKHKAVQVRAANEKEALQKARLENPGVRYIRATPGRFPANRVASK